MKNKRDIRRQKIASVLLVVLVPMLIVTTFHHHNFTIDTSKVCVECEIHHNPIHKNHLTSQCNSPLDNCVICHFKIIPVSEATSVQVSFYNNECVAVKDATTEYIYFTSRHFTTLRAPPSFMF